MTKVFLKQKSVVRSTSSEQKSANRHVPKKISAQVKLLVLGLLTLVSATAISLWYFWSEPLLSPITATSHFQFLRETPRSRSKKIVYGFLPFWNLKDVVIQPELSQLSYFSLTIDGSGNLKTQDGGGTEPGYAKLQSEEFLDLSSSAREQNTAVELTLTQFNVDDAVAFLTSSKAQETLFKNLDALLLSYPINGINIDIELSGSYPANTKNNLTAFMKALRAHLDTTYSDVALSIDMYAGAAQGDSLWDVPALAPLVDHIIVMAYDFHQRSSPQAGPVAPLFGGTEFWDSDINQHLQAFLKIVPPSKILLGIPFYGYEWKTTSRNAQSHTFPKSGSTAKISRVKELLAQKDTLKVQEQWSEAALSPFLSYEEDGEIFVLYYENSRSISYKLDYVNQLDLGGVAIWALGYEGDSRELWDVISNKLELEYNSQEK
jgi:spore germination protein